jgi:hypothetical protein
MLLSFLGAFGREGFQEAVESSTFVVARIISLLLFGKVGRGRARCLAETALVAIDGRR